LDKSREVVNRIYNLALLYRLDGDKKYADRALEELRAVAAFSDWNPSHFLDVAEMTHGFAIGYDWLFDFMSPADRTLVKTAIVEKGLRPAETIYRKGGGWPASAFNWNNVCNGGILSGALAVGDEEPVLSSYLVTKGVASLPKALASYAPDGAWAEGPGYWGYATRYTIVAFASLQSALGTDFGLSSLPGMAEAGVFRIYGAGPTSLFFNFADAGERAGTEPSLFWLARRYQNPVYAAAAKLASKTQGSALELIYYEPKGSPDDFKQLPLSRHFKGADIFFLQSGWLDKEAWYVGFKGGDNKANHSNLDLGTFIVDVLGERWGIELGPDDYNLPAYFGNKRWTYYRMRTEGQNTLVVNGQNQDPKAAARFVGFNAKPGHSWGIVDMTAAYTAEVAEKVWRGIKLLNQENCLQIQDEVSFKKPVEVVWSMHTKAQIQVKDQTAILNQNGRKLFARILTPSLATFAGEDVQIPPPQRPSKGIRKLSVRLPEKVQNERIVVQFSIDEIMKSTIHSLENWQNP
jgi:hypothetical protein